MSIDFKKVAEEIIKEKPYACTWEGCIKRFKKHQKLKAHICMVHKGVKPYPCDSEGCGKSFQTPSKLRKHQLVHSDSKRYACGDPGCDIFFSKWSLLQKHNKLFHKSAPCSICGKVVLKSNLKSHIKIHDNNRPVVPCTYEGCTKMYSTERTLATHVKTVHEKAPDAPKFKCEYEGCGMGFEFKHVLEKHVQRKHVNPQPRKKRSDAIESTILDDLFGFTENEAIEKLPFACSFPDCEQRYSKERHLRKHLKSSAHQSSKLTGTDFLRSMDEIENQTIRNMIELNIEAHTNGNL
ncbi:hypothetical protein BGZ49_007012 [Haplosporangium sp. Z 27]|nr:hypothetical protein BGZ49_007012 [Haplosporangium sp. Z 27]